MKMLGVTIVKNVAQAQSDAVLVASCGAVGQRSIVVSVSVCYRTAVVDTHTHIRLTAPCPGLPRWAGTRKVKSIWILLEQETVSGSGIS